MVGHHDRRRKYVQLSQVPNCFASLYTFLVPSPSPSLSYHFPIPLHLPCSYSFLFPYLFHFPCIVHDRPPPSLSRSSTSPLILPLSIPLLIPLPLPLPLSLALLFSLDDSSRQSPECTHSARLDLQLIVDSSYSVGESNFASMMRVNKLMN